MEFQTLSTPSLKDLFVNTIQSAILSGELKVGEKLPSEREFSEKMQVSRAVVNAGLSELMDRGLVEVRPRKGTYVADFKRNGNLETLNAILDYRDISFADSSIRSLLEFRKLTDHLAVDRIIPTASDDEIKLLKKKINAMNRAENIEDTVSCALEYYHEFCYASGDMILPLIVMSFKESISKLWTKYCRSYGTESLKYSLSQMFRYVEARDLEKAHQWADETLNRSISGDRPVYDT